MARIDRKIQQRITEYALMPARVFLAHRGHCHPSSILLQEVSLLLYVCLRLSESLPAYHETTYLCLTKPLKLVPRYTQYGVYGTAYMGH